MRAIDRVYDLCEQKGRTIYALCKILGINQSTVSTWKSKPGRDMDVKYLEGAAKFLGVSVEYLVTGNEPSSSRYTSDDEDKVISMLRSLPDRDRYIFIGRLQEACSNLQSDNSQGKRSLA